MQLESIDKSAIISTRGWTNSLGTVHSKMGSPTFVNELVHILRDIRFTMYSGKYGQSKGDYSKIHNWSPLRKALLFPLGDGQTALVLPTQRWAA